MSEKLDKLENFENAFRLGTAGCRRTCNCGKEYYDGTGQFYSWEDGEFEELENGPAIALDFAPGDIGFEGRDYVDACDCWHARAVAIIAFLDLHAQQVAEYLSLEKTRKRRIADAAPMVQG